MAVWKPPTEEEWRTMSPAQLALLFDHTVDEMAKRLGPVQTHDTFILALATPRA